MSLREVSQNQSEAGVAGLEQVVKGGMLLKLRLNSNGEVGGGNNKEEQHSKLRKQLIQRP